MSVKRGASPEAITRLPDPLGPAHDLEVMGQRLAESVVSNAGERLTEAAARITEVAGTSGREWDVLLITAGKSKNGRDYPADVLQRAAPLFEGVSCYMRHRQRDEEERHPLDKVGKFTQAAWNETDSGITARLRVVNPQARALLMEMHETGETDFVGFSIDARGDVNDRTGRVNAITKANCVDLVAEPAAGGRLQRLVASAEHQPAEEFGMDPETQAQMAALKDQMAAFHEALKASQVAMAATATAVIEPPKPEPEPTPPARLTEAESRALLKGRIAEAFEGVTLSEAGRKYVVDNLMFAAKKGDVTDDDITEAVRRQQDYEAAQAPAKAESMAESRITVGDDRKDKVHKALIAWFYEKAPPDGIKPLRSLQEGYCRWNGIDYFDLNVEDFAESFNVVYKGSRTHERLKETMTSATWGQVFADVMYLRLIDEFGAMQEIDDWRKIVSDIVSVSDFRTYHYARVGGYADMTQVAEGAPYPLLTTPTDEETTFSISKFGGIDDWTMEAALNDKTNKVRQLPRKMAQAASRTLYKFLLNLVTVTNPTLAYDSTALYAAGHNNTGTTALSLSGLEAVEIAMRDQVPYNISDEVAGRRNMPHILIVPNELKGRAQRIVNPSDAYIYGISSPTDGETVMDPARFKGDGMQVIVNDYMTDATDWFTIANPALRPTVVAGFLNGNTTPELFIADDPTQGSMFTADKTAAKVRLIYGAAVLDHRSFYRQVVSG